MLWYKNWLESRWRFFIGLAILLAMACGAVFDYPAVSRLIPATRAADISGNGPLAHILRSALEVQRDFRGFIWWQWFRQNLTQTLTLFAILLGSGGLVSQASGGPQLFTLSMPASRRRLLGVRAATNLAELAVLAIVPSLLIPLLAPAIGQSYGVADLFVHIFCVLVAGSVFFSLALLVSTSLGGVWPPLMIALAAALALATIEQIAPGATTYGVFHTMAAESYFRTHHVPWIGLAVAAMLSTALFYGAMTNLDQRDF